LLLRNKEGDGSFAAVVFFFFSLVALQRRQQLCIEEEGDDSCRHLLRWLCYKETATSAFFYGFATKKVMAAISSPYSMVMILFYFSAYGLIH